MGTKGLSNNRFTPARVMEILEDVRTGLQRYKSKDVKTRSGDNFSYAEEKTREHEGYITIEAGLVANGVYRQKLSEWEKKFSDNQEITDTIKDIRGLAEATIVKRASEGSMPQLFAMFLLRSNYNYNDNPAHNNDNEDKKERPFDIRESIYEEDSDIEVMPDDE